MRWEICIILSGLMVGCAAQGHQSEKANLTTGRTYAPSAAASLAFDPPVTIGQPALQLSREGRATDAFMGYDSLTVTSYYLRTDDRQADDCGGRFERRAVSTKVGVSYR